MAAQRSLLCTSLLLWSFTWNQMWSWFTGCVILERLFLFLDLWSNWFVCACVMLFVCTT
jgi:hypothetical protein